MKIINITWLLLIISGGVQAEAIYEINTCNDLSTLEAYPTATFELMNNIDCQNIERAPIGWETWRGLTPFSGTLNGNGFSISNLTIKPQDGETRYSGLFKKLDGATIKDIKISNFTVTGDSQDIPSTYSGALAGYVNNSNIDSVILNKANIIGDYTGSLAGYLGNSTVTNSHSFNFELPGHIHSLGGRTVGGLIGHVEKSTIASTSVDGIITAQARNLTVGGAFGKIYNTNIINNLSSTEINLTANNTYAVGGFAGHVNNSAEYNFENNNSLGSVSSLASSEIYYESSFIGYIYQATIKNSHSRTVSNTSQHTLYGAIAGHVIWNSSFDHVIGTTNNTDSIDTCLFGQTSTNATISISASHCVVSNSL